MSQRCYWRTALNLLGKPLNVYLYPLLMSAPMAKGAYMDNARTTFMLPDALKAMEPYLCRAGVTAGIYSLAVEASELLEEAAAGIAATLGVSGDELYLTSGATEANNLAIRNVLLKGGHVVCSEIEHPSVLKVLDFLRSQGIAEVDRFGVTRTGRYNLEDLEAKLRRDTRLVCLMTASHVFGTVQPIKEAVEVVREKAPDATVLLDAASGYGYMAIDLKELGVDLASISGHKIHGPGGTGALYVKKDRKIAPLLFGEASIFRYRQGAENVAGAVGFAAAAKAVHRNLSSDVAAMARLRDRLIDGLLEIDHTHLNGDRTRRICNNANITFDYVEGEAISMHLDMYGISVATGSACASQMLKPNYALIALGLRPEDAHGSIRFTLSRLTGEDEVEYVLSHVPGVVERLRSLSSAIPGRAYSS